MRSRLRSVRAPSGAERREGVDWIRPQNASIFMLKSAARTVWVSSPTEIYIERPCGRYRRWSVITIADLRASRGRWAIWTARRMLSRLMLSSRQMSAPAVMLLQAGCGFRIPGRTFFSCTESSDACQLKPRSISRGCSIWFSTPALRRGGSSTCPSCPPQTRRTRAGFPDQTANPAGCNKCNPVRDPVRFRCE